MSELPTPNLERETRKKMDAIADKHQRQSDKFKQLARELETNEDEAAFDQALKKVGKQTRDPKVAGKRITPSGQ